MPYDITQDQWDNDDIEILWRMDKELIRKGVAYAPTKDSDVWADGDDVMGLIDVGPQHFDLVPTTAAKYKDTGGPSAGDIYLAFDGSTSSRYYTTPDTGGTDILDEPYNGDPFTLLMRLFLNQTGTGVYSWLVRDPGAASGNRNSWACTAPSGGGNLAFFTKDGDGVTMVTLSSTISLSTGTWYNFAVTGDSTRVDLFVDDMSTPQASDTSPTTTTGTHPLDLRIGARWDAATFFDGGIMGYGIFGTKMGQSKLEEYFTWFEGGQA